MTEIPEFDCYYPSEDMMDSAQLLFYKKVEMKLSNGEYIDVNGNIGYVFTYLYKLLNKYSNRFSSLSEFLIHVSELYSGEDKIVRYCKTWGYDCLLGSRKYDEYLNKTEPTQIYGANTHESSVRLNLQRIIGVDINPVDLLLVTGGRRSKFIENNQLSYKECVIDVFNNHSQITKEWLSILNDNLKEKSPYLHPLFHGAFVEQRPKVKDPFYYYYTIFSYMPTIKELALTAENLARDKAGIPRVGEGWVSETELFKKLELEFSYTKVIQHGRPLWLERQHFDIWFPHWNVAIEYHGRQHFEAVEFFGGALAYEKTKRRDEKKQHLHVTTMWNYSLSPKVITMTS